MRAGWFYVPALIALSGCSTYPLPDDVTRKSTYDIIQQIRCEARRAVMDYGYNYKTASVSYEFEFDITEDNNASADATWTLPYSLGGSFSLAANAGLNRSRHTNRDIRLVDSFDELRQMRCGEQNLRENIIYPIAGQIGVYEVVQTFIRLQDIHNPSSGEVFSFADKLMFTTTLMGGVKPTLVISPLPDRLRLASANGDFNAQRIDVHTVTLGLAGSPSKTGKPVGTSLRTLVAGGSRSGSSGVVPMGTAGSGGVQTNSSLVSTTTIQSATDPKDRALVELDRQRILTIQARSQNLLTGP